MTWRPKIRNWAGCVKPTYQTRSQLMEKYELTLWNLSTANPAQILAVGVVRTMEITAGLYCNWVTRDSEKTHRKVDATGSVVICIAVSCSSNPPRALTRGFFTGDSCQSVDWYRLLYYRQMKSKQSSINRCATLRIPCKNIRGLVRFEYLPVILKGTNDTWQRRSRADTWTCRYVTY